MNFKITETFKTKIPLLWLTPAEFKSGVRYAKENNIKALFLWSNSTEAETWTLDFSWLSECPHLEHLECMLHLSPKSNISGFYSLKNLKSLVYFNYDKVPLDHNKLQAIEYLYTHYHKNQTLGESRFDILPRLGGLKLWHIKNHSDCAFLGKLRSLKHLELTWSRALKSLNGIELLSNLERLSLRNQYTLEDVSHMALCSKLKSVWVEGCKHINEVGIKQIKAINNHPETNK